MEAKTYSDFDLRFTREGEGYRAEIMASPGGTGGHAFQLDFKEHEIENYLLRIGDRRSGMRSAASPESTAAREFGSRLFEMVFQGDLKFAFRASLEATRSERLGLRIRLRFGDAPELADLPWEYLYRPGRREFLALSVDTPVVRFFELEEARAPLPVTPPLRVLVMLSNPSDVDCLNVEDEWKKLKDAVRPLEDLKLLVVERLEKATLSELQRRLRGADYHIFHFVGHGHFDPRTEEGALAFEDEAGRKRLVTGSDLGIYLQDERALRLVVLNACEGARGSRKDPFSGAAQSLILKNVPAVIAMQFEVGDAAAISFTQGFYGALADDYPVDAALAEARKAMYACDNSVEWGTPVLYLSAPDGRIFDIRKAANEAASETAGPQRHFPLPQLPPVVPEPALSPVLENRAPRRWVWLLAGIIGTIGFFAALGIWSKNHTPQPAPAAESVVAEEPGAPAATVEPLVTPSDPAPSPSSSASDATGGAAPESEAPAGVPRIVASSAPGQAPGTRTLTWDGGPDHKWAEVWVKVDDQDETFVVEQGKGTREVTVEPGKTYLYILADNNTRLATVLVKDP